jgi:hypothetical protein
MQMLAEEHSEESLRIFSQGAEQMMMTAMSRHATEDEGKFQSEEQLEEAGVTSRRNGRSKAVREGS